MDAQGFGRSIGGVYYDTYCRSFVSSVCRQRRRFRKNGLIILPNLIQELPHLRRFARSLTGDASTADDLVQYTAEKALKAKAKFVGSGRYRSWLFTILYRTYLDEQMRFHKRGETSIEAAADIATAENAGAKMELQQTLLLLQKLPEELRATLTLIAVEGFTYQEVASMTDVPIGTVMSRLHRARAKLKDLMERKAGKTAHLRTIK